MKLLVLSDTHRQIKRMVYAAEQAVPDMILHLGDNISDAMLLRERLPRIPFHMVTGNCDPASAGKSELLIEIEDVRIFLTHGHRYHVKSDLIYLVHRAKESGVDLALFGHTHGAWIDTSQGFTLMNPGQMERHEERRKASYGMIHLTEGKFDCNIVYLPDEMQETVF